MPFLEGIAQKSHPHTKTSQILTMPMKNPSYIKGKNLKIYKTFMTDLKLLNQYIKIKKK